ncbi:TonB-dependent receptor [Arsenophonus endosymbiont of Aleurodicus floccissimus]|uniref:TonB-dependent receptor n=1 Tax=Arsenophonus endosymbiont of Aleurodicus floccissimus TaxID=2152761 RepID=UPI002104E276|nr:TonB-dependent receptor [Arsenophonus endosymbiont of Aleurodicus floccissimus]
MEEFEAGPLRYELGVRHEWQKIDVTKGSRSRQHGGTSGSAGVTWTLAPEYALTASLSHSKRLPIAEELYANGIHAATRTIETGNEHLKAESATNIDIGFTKFAGDFQFGLNTYYNYIDGYIYGKDTSYSPGAGYRHLHYVQQDAVFNAVKLKHHINLLIIPSLRYKVILLKPSFVVEAICRVFRLIVFRLPLNINGLNL